MEERCRVGIVTGEYAGRGQGENGNSGPELEEYAEDIASEDMVVVVLVVMITHNMHATLHTHTTRPPSNCLFLATCT